MAGVRVANLVMKYGGLTALKGISFECQEGEFFTLLGPSGAGKTTTLELIAGIKTPAEGEIFIGNRLVNRLPPHERNVAMAFEKYALYPHFSVYENISFPLRSPKRLEKLTPQQERARVKEIASLLGIETLLERKPQQLSGGQKQRVSLARAMVRRPEVYLLDEPIAHLDAKLKVSARSTLKQLANRLGTTIIYVTHDYREALGLSDRLLVMRKGRVEQVGPPEELYHFPRTDFVARLIGAPPINLVDGEVEVREGKAFFATEGGFQFELKPELLDRLGEVAWKENGRRMVRIGIRPQHVRISTQKMSAASFQLPVYVVVSEAEASLITFELPECFFQTKVEGRVRYKAGEALWVEIDQDKLYFFRRSVELTK